MKDNFKTVENFSHSLEAHQPKILLVDDEETIRRVLETRLEMKGYQVITAIDGVIALDIYQQELPDLVILDVTMPKLDGFSVCQALRQESDVPIIMLTAKADIADRIRGLELGADDYIVKPFSPKELESRIRCILRRTEKPCTKRSSNSGVIRVGELVINTNNRQVHNKDVHIRLTSLEFSLLELLTRHAGEPISRLEILAKVWGYTLEHSVDTRVVDVHVSRLRDKLQENSQQAELIVTVRGTGYAFQRQECTA